MRHFLSISFALLLAVSAVHAQTWTIFDSLNSNLQSNSVVEIDQGGSNEIWVATSWEGLNRYNGSWTWWTGGNSPIPSSEVSMVVVLSSGDKAVGTRAHGLALFNGTFAWAPFSTGNSAIPDDHIRAGAADGDTLWIGTEQGVGKFDGNTWTSFTTANSGLPSDTVHGVAVDLQGRKWFSTNAGLALLDAGTWSVFTPNNSPLLTLQPGRLRADPGQGVWICTASNGIYHYDGTNWLALTALNSGLPNNHVTDISFDPGGIGWVATYGGLGRYDGSAWSTFNTGNSPLPTDTLSAVEAVSGSRVWIGTAGAGVVLYDTLTIGLPAAQVLATRVIPHPVERQSRLVFGQELPAGSSFALYSATGHLLRKEAVSGTEMTLTRAGLPAGIYFFEISDQEGRALTRRKLLLQ